MSVQCVFAAQQVGLPMAAAGLVSTVDGNFLGDFERTAKDVFLERGGGSFGNLPTLGPSPHLFRGGCCSFLL